MKIETDMHIYTFRPLSTRVLVVAAINKIARDFAVYIDAVDGQNHEEEFMQVAKTGSKLDKRIAKILFSNLFEKYSWRK